MPRVEVGRDCRVLKAGQATCPMQLPGFSGEAAATQPEVPAEAARLAQLLVCIR